MSDTRFNHMLRRYRNGTLSQQEKEEVDQWLDSLSSTEEEEKVSWPREDQDARFTMIKNEIKRTENLDNEMTWTVKRNNMWIWAAATITLLVVAAWLIVPRALNPVIGITEIDGDVRKTRLNDGTIVWLQSASKLSYTESADGTQRLATLEGEGLFEVAKDPQRPFVIRCNEVSVRVVGTSFSLRAVGDSVELKVLTGKVNFSSPENRAGFDVMPNEMAVYKADNPATKMLMRAEEFDQIIAIEQYTMNFHNTPMKEIFERIEKKFDVDISVKNAKVNACRLTADLTDHSLDDTLMLLTEVLDIKYEVKLRLVTITGEGCP